MSDGLHYPGFFGESVSRIPSFWDFLEVNHLVITLTLTGQYLEEEEDVRGVPKQSVHPW